MALTDADRDIRMVDVLEEALSLLREGKDVDAGTLRARYPDLGEIPELLGTLRHLDAAADHWKTGRAAADPLTATPGPEATPDPGTSEFAEAPRIIGRYRILEQLGAGGMGTVYKAHDPQLQRVVAVKLPHFERRHPRHAQAVQRFLREARAAASIRHPHICPIHDVGEHDGTPYLVLACIEGSSLAALLKQGPLTVARSVDLVRKIALGLEAVHAEGLIHRDLKPANILLDAAGEPLVTDFGLARALSDGDHLTQEGAVVGTPSYMAPEQALAQNDRIGPWTDVYSLGVVLYQLLTGRLPFERKSLAAFLQSPPPAPPPPSALCAGLDPALEAIVLKALAPRPEDRYQKAGDLAAALAGLACPAAVATGQEPGTITMDPVSPARPEPTRRRRGPLALVAAAVLVLMIGAAWLVPQIIIRITTKDGKVTELKVPEGAKVEIINPVPPPLPAGGPLSPLALVIKPALIKGVDGWTLETRAPRGQINALAYQPPMGRLLAGAGRDGSIRLWEADSGKLVRILVGHEEPVASLSWSPDGKSLASASIDKTVRIWEIESGKSRFILHDNLAIRAVAWSPDGKTLAAAGDAGVVKLWDPHSGILLQKDAIVSTEVYALAWSPDSETLAWGGSDKTVRLRNLKTAELIVAKGHSAPVQVISWSPDGKTLASGDAGKDQAIRLWHGQSGELVRTLETKGRTTGLTWSPDGKTLASLGWGGGGGYGQTIEFWDSGSGKEKKTLPTQTFFGGDTRSNLALPLVWSPDGKTVVTCGTRGSTNGYPEVRFWDAKSLTLKKTVVGQAKQTIPVAWSPQGQTLVTGAYDGVFFWKSETGAVLHTCDHSRGFDDLSWSPNGKYIAATRDGGYWASLLDPRTGKSLRTLKALSTTWGMAWSPDSKRIAIGDLQVVRLWEAESGQLIKDLKDPNNPQKGHVYDLAWSPDGKTLVSGGDEETGRFWDVESGQVLRTIQQKRGISSFVWSQDGKTLYSCRTETTIGVWHAESGKFQRFLEGHTGPVYILAGSPDGKLLASGSTDQTIRIWDIGSGTHVRTISGHTGSVEKLAWSADSKNLASSGDQEGTVRIWEVATGRQVGTLLPLMDSKGLAIAPDGNYRGTPGIDGDLVYIVQTERGQETLSPEEFGKRYGWKNDPGRVRLTGKVEPAEEGWVPLFNGRDLQGWKPYEGAIISDWKVDEGILIGRLEKERISGKMLVSERGDYANFHLRFEAKINDGGACYFGFRSPPKTEGLTGWRAMINISHDKVRGKTGFLQSYFDKEISAAKADTWFTEEIIARGPRIIVKVDGRITADFVDTKHVYSKGLFYLWHHPGSEVHFRKIEIKELAADPH